MSSVIRYQDTVYTPYAFLKYVAQWDAANLAGNFVERGQGTQAGAGDLVGYVNDMTAYQPNLVTNGTFDTDSDWEKNGAWIISGGKARYNGSIANETLKQTITIPAAGKYYVICTYDEVSTGTFSISHQVGTAAIDSTGAAPSITAPGTYSREYNFSSGGTFTTSMYNSTAPSEGVLAEVSIKAVGQNLIAPADDLRPVLDIDLANPPELLVNGDFSQGTTGWGINANGTYAVVGGVLEVTRTVDAFDRAYQAFPTEIGKRYRCEIDQVAGGTWLGQMRIGQDIYGHSYGSVNAADKNVTERIVLEFEALTETTYFTMTASNNTHTSRFDNASVKRVPKSTTQDTATWNFDGVNDAIVAEWSTGEFGPADCSLFFAFKQYNTSDNLLFFGHAASRYIHRWDIGSSGTSVANGVGSNWSVWIDGVELVNPTMGSLEAACSDGEYHVVEWRNVSFETWGYIGIGDYQAAPGPYAPKVDIAAALIVNTDDFTDDDRENIIMPYMYAACGSAPLDEKINDIPMQLFFDPATLANNYVERAPNTQAGDGDLVGYVNERNAAEQTEQAVGGTFETWTNNVPDGWNEGTTQTATEYLQDVGNGCRVYSETGNYMGIFQVMSGVTSANDWVVSFDLEVVSGSCKVGTGAGGSDLGVYATSGSYSVLTSSGSWSNDPLNLNFGRNAGSTDFTLRNVSVKSVGQSLIAVGDDTRPALTIQPKGDGIELVTNGDQEADRHKGIHGDYPSGLRMTNALSTDYANGGTQSLKYTADASGVATHYAYLNGTTIKGHEAIRIEFDLYVPSNNWPGQHPLLADVSDGSWTIDLGSTKSQWVHCVATREAKGSDWPMGLGQNIAQDVEQGSFYVDNLSIQRLSQTETEAPFFDFDGTNDELKATFTHTPTADCSVFQLVRTWDSGFMLFNQGSGSYCWVCNSIEGNTTLHAGYGDNVTLWIDGEQVAEGTTRAELQRLISTGKWHVLEARNLDMTGKLRLDVGHRLSYPFNGEMAAIVMVDTADLDDAARNTITQWMRSKIQ